MIYRITKRYAVIVDTTVNAESLEEAVQKSHDLELDDFISFKKNAGLVDCETMTGTGVSEDC